MREKSQSLPEIVSYSVRNGELLGVQRGTYSIITLARIAAKESIQTIDPTTGPLQKKRTRGPNKPKPVVLPMANGAVSVGEGQSEVRAE